MGSGCWNVLPPFSRRFVVTFLFCAGIPFFKGNVRSSSHWDCRPPSHRRKTTLPSHFSVSTSLTMSHLTLFHTGTAHKTVFPFPHKALCWFMCCSPPPSPPPLPPPHSKFAPSNRHSRFERYKLVCVCGGGRWSVAVPNTYTVGVCVTHTPHLR